MAFVKNRTSTRYALLIRLVFIAWNVHWCLFSCDKWKIHGNRNPIYIIEYTIVYFITYWKLLRMNGFPYNIKPHRFILIISPTILFLFNKKSYKFMVLLIASFCIRETFEYICWLFKLFKLHTTHNTINKLNWIYRDSICLASQSVCSIWNNRVFTFYS